MPNFCPTCGKPLQYENAEICPNCGVRIQPLPAVSPQELRSPILAGILSFLFAGWGQWYNGKTGDGLKFFAVFWALYIVMIVSMAGANVNPFLGVIGLLVLLPMLIIWVYGMYNAYTMAEKINRREEQFLRKSRLFWLPVVLFILAILLFIVFAIIAAFIFGMAGAQSAYHGYSSLTPQYVTGYSSRFANPGFESGNLNGWTTGSTTSILGDRSHGGTYSCHFDMSGTQASDYISQEVDLTGANSISFWGTGESNTWPFTISIDGTLVQSPNAVSNTWTRYTVPVSGYSGVHTVTVKWNGGPGMYGADIDDFSLS